MNIRQMLDELLENNNYRSLKNVENIDCTEITVDDTKYINFTSNDYLSFNCENFEELFLKNKFKLGASSSRLLTGNHKAYQEIEQKFEVNYERPALHFNSGFHANEAIINLFLTNEDVVFCDILNHSSIYTGIKQSGAKVVLFNHLDYKHLEQQLVKYRNNYKNALIVSESIYSMDGDICDIHELVDLKIKHNTMLMIDECHSYGVVGDDGLGLVKKHNLIKMVDFLVLGFGKAGYSIGAMVLCTESSKRWIINKGKNFIYTTALPELNVAWNSFIFDRIVESKGKREALSNLTDHLLNLFDDAGIETKSTSHIVSVVLGERVDDISKELIENGFLVYPIKHPTVRKGEERIRLSLNASHKIEDIEKVVEIICQTN